MKIIQTFWSGKSTDGSLLNQSGGWLSPEYNWMAWALGCLQLRSLFGEVELYTDSNGKKILVDLLQLPYTRVHIVHDDTLDRLPTEVWAIAKLKTYALQNEPFLHFDGDLFLWEKPADEILNAQLIAQNMEKGLEFYPVTLDEINREFNYLPPFCRHEYYSAQPVISINAGIIGGSNLAFYREQYKLAQEFLAANRHQLHLLKTENLNFIFEQYFFYELAKQACIPVSFASTHVVDDLMYGEYVNFSRIPEIGFIHPVSGHKKNLHVCDNLSRTLRWKYPEVYERVLDTCRNAGLLMFNKVYVSGNALAIPIGSMDESYFFNRTRLAVNYFNKEVMKTVHGAGDTGNGNQNDAVPVINETTFSEVLQKLRLPQQKFCVLTELFELEKKRKEVFEAVYCDTMGVTASCIHDNEVYAELQEVFHSCTELLADVVISRNEQVRDLWVSNNWTCHEQDKFHFLLADNFAERERKEEQLVLVPKIARLELDEYFLDELDGILFACCGKPEKIRAIIHHCKSFFDETEINANLPAFERLITDSVSRLCFLDVLVIRRETSTHPTTDSLFFHH